MTRPTILYISQFAHPGTYRKETWRRILGQDDELPGIEALLDAAGVLNRARLIGVQAHRGEALPVDAGHIDAVILGGSFASVSDGYSWQLHIADWLRKLRPMNKPLLGICGGHQIMAHVLGGRVEKIPAGPEVGSLPVTLTEAGRRHPLFDGFDTESKFYFANSDHVVERDRDAIVLATRPNLPSAALEHGGRWVSVQFHPELTCDRMATCWMEQAPERAAAYSFVAGCERVVVNFLKSAGVG